MTLTLKEKKLALLEETANHFNLGNRSTLGGCATQCRYGGVGCAIGRKIRSRKLRDKLDNAPWCGVTAIFDELPSYLQKFGIPFLNQLQNLHDIIRHWTETGLSESGVRYVAEMKRLIEDGKI